MTAPRVLVVGGGAAGTAAAWSARRAGALVTLLHAGPGATALYSGALDREPWSERARPAAADELTVAFAVALGIWRLGGQPARISTLHGELRPALGRDRALLDLAPFAGKCVAVADALHREHDPRLLVRALEASTWARSARTRFELRDVPGLLDESEQNLSSYDLAKRFDDPERSALVARALTAGGEAPAAWLLGPWLGLEVDVAGLLTEAVGVPVGEVSSPPGGAAGGRFEWARDRLLADQGVSVERGVATDISRDGAGWVVTAGDRQVAAERVVLAFGGVQAGGIRLGAVRPEEPLSLAFRASLAGELPLELDGEPVDRNSTLFGVDFVARGVDVLSRVGLAVDGAAVRGCSGLYAAGDAIAGRPRAVLEAIAAGIAAGAAAAGA